MELELTVKREKGNEKLNGKWNGKWNDTDSYMHTVQRISHWNWFIDLSLEYFMPTGWLHARLISPGGWKLSVCLSLDDNSFSLSPPLLEYHGLSDGTSWFMIYHPVQSRHQGIRLIYTLLHRYTHTHWLNWSNNNQSHPNKSSKPVQSSTNEEINGILNEWMPLKVITWCRPQERVMGGVRVPLSAAGTRLLLTWIP